MEGLTTTTQNSVRIAVGSAEIRTERLPDTSVYIETHTGGCRGGVTYRKTAELEQLSVAATIEVSGLQLVGLKTTLRCFGWFSSFSGYEWLKRWPPCKLTMTVSF
jgi:hypothetical protein